MTHKGFRITARNTTTVGCKGLDVRIDGYVFTVRADRNRPVAIADAVRYVDASLARPEAYTWTRDLTAEQLAVRVAA